MEKISYDKMKKRTPTLLHGTGILYLMLLFLILFTAFPSCKSNSPAIKKIDAFFQTKRYKNAVHDRDSLRNLVGILKTDTAREGTIFRDTTLAYERLAEKYSRLANASGLKLAKLSADLDAKSEELNKKEALLKSQDKKLKEMQRIVSREDSITSALNTLVKNALLGFNAEDLSVKIRNGKVYVSMSDKLLFRSGSATVEEKGQQAIRKLAEVLNKNPEIEISIEGHTDNVPISTEHYKDNWDLSVARATSIVRMLIESYQVNPQRLTASGKSSYFPVASNDTPEGRAKNRRTEIILSPKLDELFNLLQAKNKG